MSDFRAGDNFGCETFGEKLVSYLEVADMEADILISHGYRPELNERPEDNVIILDVIKQKEGSGE